jgi:hypothetical protein
LPTPSNHYHYGQRCDCGRETLEDQHVIPLPRAVVLTIGEEAGGE